MLINLTPFLLVNSFFISESLKLLSTKYIQNSVINHVYPSVMLNRESPKICCIVLHGVAGRHFALERIRAAAMGTWVITPLVLFNCSIASKSTKLRM